MSEIEYNSIVVNTDTLSIEDAIAAAERIFDAQEEDFQEIKKEKWFKSLLNSISFGADRKKIIKDIRSLSKLQILFMKIYREYYKNTSEQLERIINNLRETNSVVKNLYYSCVLNIHPQAQVDELSITDQEILKLVLNEYLGVNNEPLLKKYRASIAKVATIKGCPEGNLSLEQLGKLSKPEVVYRCLAEMKALDNTPEFPSNINDAIDYLSVSPKRKQEIESTVKREVDSYGADYLFDKYACDIKEDIVIDERDFVYDESDIDKHLTVTINEDFINFPQNQTPPPQFLEYYNNAYTKGTSIEDSKKWIEKINRGIHYGGANPSPLNLQDGLSLNDHYMKCITIYLFEHSTEAGKLLRIDYLSNNFIYAINEACKSLGLPKFINMSYEDLERVRIIKFDEPNLSPAALSYFNNLYNTHVNNTPWLKELEINRIQNGEEWYVKEVQSMEDLFSPYDYFKRVGRLEWASHLRKHNLFEFYDPLDYDFWDRSPNSVDPAYL